MKKVLVGIGLIVILLSNTCFAAQFSMADLMEQVHRKTFSPVNSFTSINVERVGNLDAFGLTQEYLDDYANMLLQQNFTGIKVLSSEQFFASETPDFDKTGNIMVYVWVTGKDNIYAAYVEVKMGTWNNVHAWRDARLGTLGKSAVKERVKEAIKDMMESAAMRFYKSRLP